MTVLTRTARLTLILHINVGIARNGFLVCNLRSAYVSLYLELTQKSVHDDFQVKLAHTRDNGLPRFRVGPGFECGVFLRELREGNSHLFLTCLGLRLDSQIDNRLGELHRLKNYGVILIAQRIARGGVLGTYYRRNIAAGTSVYILSVVGVHL